MPPFHSPLSHLKKPIIHASSLSLFFSLPSQHRYGMNHYKNKGDEKKNLK